MTFSLASKSPEEERNDQTVLKEDAADEKTDESSEPQEFEVEDILDYKWCAVTVSHLL